MAKSKIHDAEEMKSKKDVEGLIKALMHEKSVDVCEYAAKALGTIGDPRAVQPLISMVKDTDINRKVRRASALSLQYMYRLLSLDEQSKRQIQSVEWVITKMIKDVDKEKEKVLEGAKIWWLGKPDPKDGNFICDACNGKIREKEGTSWLGGYMRCSGCTERLFLRWDNGED